MAVLQWVKKLGLEGVLAAIGIMSLVGGAVLLANFVEEPYLHFATELGKTALALGTGLILGGALKIMLDRYHETVAKKQKAHELRERLLADLRDVHDRAEAARLMHADMSGDTYRQHVRELIRCQVVLLKVKRSLDLPAVETHDVDPGRVLLAKLIGYLRVLQDEFTRNDAQSPLLQDLTTGANIYKERFRKPLYELSRQLLGDGTAEPNEGDFDICVERVIGRGAEEQPPAK